MDAFEALRPGDPEQVGPYRIVARLGAGGMGRVYLGQSRGGRAFAVKVVRPELAENGDFRRRFVREVASARRVNGVFTAGVVDADPEGSPAWLATAYVAGVPLDQAVAEHGPWPQEPSLALAAALAEALEAIHAAGVVHRDLKPSNVLLASDGPRVIDFGVSIPHESETAITGTGEAVGTPGFMSPEQLTGHPVGPASDVFSLGAVLALVATGAGPFGRGSLAEVSFRVVYQEPSLDGIPAQLRDVISRCLAKQPQERPTVGVLLDELAASVNGSGADTAAFTRAGWLPEAVARAVHARSAAPPPPTDPRTAAGPAGPDTAVSAADGDTPPPRSRTAAPDTGAHPATALGDRPSAPAPAPDRATTTLGVRKAPAGTPTAPGEPGLAAEGRRPFEAHGGRAAYGAQASASSPQPPPFGNPAMLAGAAPSSGSQAGTGPQAGPATVPAGGSPAARPGGGTMKPARPAGSAGPTATSAAPSRRRSRRQGPPRGVWVGAALGVLGVAVAVWVALPSSAQNDHQGHASARAAESSPPAPDSARKATASPSGGPATERPETSASPTPARDEETDGTESPSASSSPTQEESSPAHPPNDPPKPSASPSSTETSAPPSSTSYAIAAGSGTDVSGDVIWYDDHVRIGGSVTSPSSGGCTKVHFTVFASDQTSTTQTRTACDGSSTSFGFSMDATAGPVELDVSLETVAADGTQQTVGTDVCTPSGCEVS